MPTLLEQAIIDAQELRDVALKNAESTILEKYNSEIKNVVESLLEQEEEELDIGVEDMADDDGMDEPGFAAAEGVKMCPRQEDEEVMLFNIEDLKAMAPELEDTPAMGDQEDQARRRRRGSAHGRAERDRAAGGAARADVYHPHEGLRDRARLCAHGHGVRRARPGSGPPAPTGEVAAWRVEGDDGGGGGCA